MEFPIKTFAALLVGALVFVGGPLRAQDTPDDEEGAPDDSGVTFQTFYDSLASQGNWIQSSDYGYVWQPNVNDPEWAPYTDGYWVYTEDGWTWVSNEPWGWATYHYGRWVNIDGVGWCWVPGYVWAPAWVSWRYGDDYCGWAPLPPDSFVGIDYGDDDFDIGVGFHIGGDCDGFFGIGPGGYCFLPVRCLGYRNYHGYYANRHDNFAIINHTTNVTSINFTRNGSASVSGTPLAGNFRRVTLEGPSLSQVNALSETPIQRASLVVSNQPGGGTLSNQSLALYAPHITAGQTARPGYVPGMIGHTTVNRGMDVTRPPAVNQRLAPSAPTSEQIQQAHLAQANAPASAKVMGVNTPFKPVLNAPLTSFKPATTPNSVRSPQVYPVSPSIIHSPTPYAPQPGFSPGMGVPHNSGPGPVNSGGGGSYHSVPGGGGGNNGGGSSYHSVPGGGGGGGGNNGGGGGSRGGGGQGGGNQQGH